VAHAGQLALQNRELREAVLGVAGQTGARGIGAHALAVVGGQEELAHRGEVQRGATAHGPHHLHARALAVSALDIDDLVALPHRQVHRLVRDPVQLAHRRQRGVAHRQAGLHQVAQLQQAHAQTVEAGLRPVDETADHQVVEDAVCGGRMQASALGDVFQRHRLGLRGQHVQQRKTALQNLDRGGGGFKALHGREFSHGENSCRDPAN
jgi:hypothetical protein